MRRTWVILLGVLVVAGACQDYDESGEWKGWLDFEAKALFKGAVCGERSFESAVDALADDENTLIQSMYIAADSWDEMQDRVECQEKAKTCEEFWRCRIPENAENCDESSFEEYCDGDVAVRCSYFNTNSENNYYIRRIDCASAPVSGSCSVMTGYAYCRFDLCGIPGAIACDDPEGPRREVCDGHYIHHCSSLGAYSEDCREVDPDFVCFMDQYDQARCGMPEGKWACAEHGKRWCEGSVLKACIYGKVISYDCASFEDARCEVDACVLLD